MLNKFIFLIFLFGTISGAQAQDDLNNPRNIFYKNYHKNCGKVELSTDWHTCNQDESLKALKRFFRNEEYSLEFQNTYFTIFKNYYFDLHNLVYQYEGKKITRYSLEQQIENLAENMMHKVKGLPFSRSRNDVLIYLGYKQDE